MILYSLDSSPYSAAVRIALYAKDLQIEIVEPPSGLRSTRFHAINPLGTIPCLVHDSLVLPESVAILETSRKCSPIPHYCQAIRLRARPCVSFNASPNLAS